MIIKRVIDECYKRQNLFEACDGCIYRGKQCERVRSIVAANINVNVDKKNIRPSDYITH